MSIVIIKQLIRCAVNAIGNCMSQIAGHVRYRPMERAASRRVQAGGTVAIRNLTLEASG
jgi:hypothetical protein